jgi:hypothetical protein
MVSFDCAAEGYAQIGVEGAIWAAPGTGRHALYRCYYSPAPGRLDHFVSIDKNCEGANSDGLIGYALNVGGAAAGACESPATPPLAADACEVKPMGRYFSLLRRDHWVTGNAAPLSAGYSFEGSVGQLSVNHITSATVPVYDCLVGGVDRMVSVDSRCEGGVSSGVIGYAWTTPAVGRHPVYRCWIGTDHFVSVDPRCEGARSDTGATPFLYLADDGLVGGAACGGAYGGGGETVPPLPTRDRKSVV